MLLVTLIAASCSGSGARTQRPSRVTAPASQPPDAAIEFRRYAEDTIGSLQAAVADAEPGSPAANYFSNRLFQVRAYVGAHDSATRFALMPIKGGVAICWRFRDKGLCWEYQHPRFASDGRLADFTVNYVDVGRLVRVGASKDLPTGRFQISPGTSGRVLSLVRDPLDLLSVVLRFENATNGLVALPGPASFKYQTDGSSAVQQPVGFAGPGTVAAHSFAYMAVVFEPANFGGTLVLGVAGHDQKLTVPGPAVALGNTATEGA